MKRRHLGGEDLVICWKQIMCRVVRIAFLALRERNNEDGYEQPIAETHNRNRLIPVHVTTLNRFFKNSDVIL